jgi:hypothetical protein
LFNLLGYLQAVAQKPEGEHSWDVADTYRPVRLDWDKFFRESAVAPCVMKMKFSQGDVIVPKRSQGVVIIIVLSGVCVEDGNSKRVAKRYRRDDVYGLIEFFDCKKSSPYNLLASSSAVEVMMITPSYIRTILFHNSPTLYSSLYFTLCKSMILFLWNALKVDRLPQ